MLALPHNLLVEERVRTILKINSFFPCFILVPSASPFPKQEFSEKDKQHEIEIFNPGDQKVKTPNKNAALTINQDISTNTNSQISQNPPTHLLHDLAPTSQFQPVTALSTRPLISPTHLFKPVQGLN